MTTTTGAQTFTFRGLTVEADDIESLTLYIREGIAPGSFLRAVLSNDLLEAVRRADDEHLKNVAAVAAWVHNFAPSDCVGSTAKVAAWIKGHADRRAFEDDLDDKTEVTGPALERER